MSQPDLFVVCKNCGSEVSPYVTECPYCGQRVRKRAPKIERGEEEPRRHKARRTRSLPKLRRGSYRVTVTLRAETNADRTATFTRTFRG